MRTYAAIRTSLSERFIDIRSDATRLNWLTLNMSFDSFCRSGGMMTALPISPGPSGAAGDRWRTEGKKVGIKDGRTSLWDVAEHLF